MFAKFIGYVVLMVVLVVFRGYVVQTNWDWFMVPLGLPSLIMPHALGVSGFIAYLTYQMPSKAESEEDDYLARSMIAGFILNIVFLIVGFGYHTWMLSYAN